MGLLRITPDMAFADGVFAPGAKAYFYETGTTTETTVYSDSAETTPHTNPIVADADGVFAQVFGPSAVKVVITASDDTAIATLEVVYPVGATGAAAEDLSFSPVTGNSATNVQAAIEGNTTRLNDLDSPTVQGIALLNDDTAADQRTTLGLGNAALVDVIDEDDMATDSATRPPSQQSTKAYVDASTVGQNQTWQDVSGSRSASTSYQNDTGAPIMVAVAFGTSSSGSVQVSDDDATWVTVSAHPSSSAYTASPFVVPNSHYYRVTGTGITISSWAELR